MMESNRPYQPIASNLSNNGGSGVMSGMMWGAGSGAVMGGAYSAANNYLLKGDINKMGSFDRHIPDFVRSYRSTEQMMAKYDNFNNLETAGKSLVKQNSPLTRMLYNSTFGHSAGANARRIGVMAAVGAVMGGLNRASDGVVGR